MRYGHLEKIKFKLRLLAPLFIGSGQRLTKKEYIFDTGKGKVFFPDMPKLVRFLKERHMLTTYESFLNNPRQKDFKGFLDAHNIGSKEYNDFILYSIDAGEAVNSQRFREVLTFIKDPEGRPYIPGSSLKGALRTAIASFVLKRGGWSYQRKSVEQGVGNFKGAKKYLSWENKNLEEKLFARLDIKNPRKPEQKLPVPINDLMRGIQVSDSLPLDFKHLTLTGKYDRQPDGNYKLLPIFRECLIPGSEAHFSITFDLPMLKKAGLAPSDLEKALHGFSDAYYENFEEFFAELPDDALTGAQEGVDMFLGGGAGFVSKTLIYNLFPDHKRALELTAKIMSHQFPRHKHDKDVKVYKVSPHTLKTTFYQGQYYQMGRCELIME